MASRSWRELIKKVWEVVPLLCPKCNHEMRIVSLINDAQVFERILFLLEYMYFVSLALRKLCEVFLCMNSTSF